jgi:hypothetical protein
VLVSLFALSFNRVAARSSLLSTTAILLLPKLSLSSNWAKYRQYKQFRASRTEPSGHVLFERNNMYYDITSAGFALVSTNR